MSQLAARRFRTTLLALASAFLAVHLPFLPSALEDIDSMNFALGVRAYDPVRHQPHPPGYPVYIALGKLSALVWSNEAARLAIWSAIFGALALVPLGYVFKAVDGLDDRPHAPTRPVMAVLVAACCPLFWLMAVRPLSDVPGLGLALVAQALLASAFLAQRPTTPSASSSARNSASGRLIVLGALAAAVSIGVRSQAGWLTLPLLVLVLLDRTGKGAAGAWLGSAMSFVLGVTSWAIPLIVASGGWNRYLAALSAQAGEDLAGVDMLATHPGPRQLVFALRDTLITPWGAVWLAAVLLVLAGIGLMVMIVRDRRGLLLLGATWGPYAVFHLLFQETLTVRYALPLILPVAYLAVRGASVLGERPMMLAAGSISIAGLLLGVPAARVYAASPSPVSRALAECDRSAKGLMLGMHQVFARAVLLAGRNPQMTLGAPVGHEWLELVNYFSAGDRRPVVFLADPRRTDLVLIDHAARQTLASYRWPDALAMLMSGTRPGGADLIRIDRPGWLLEQGWALTPETAGIAHLDQSRRVPTVTGLVRRRDGAVVLMIGGREIGNAADPEARVELALDGRPLHRFLVKPGRFFLSMVTLPAGVLAGPGPYGHLAVTAAAAEGPHRAVQPSIEQFDLQSADSIVFGYEDGWHELEYDRYTGRPWRWSTDRGTIAIHGSGPLTLRLTGESPLKSFDRPSQVVIRAGEQMLASQFLASDFDMTVPIPAAALAAAQGRLSIETDQSFVPAERIGSPDRRRLGLKIFGVDIR